jgi:hypothetical protein
MATSPIVTQPLYPLVLTHDEIIALSSAVVLLRETLLATGKMDSRALTTVKNLESIVEKLPEEEWFDE